MVLEPGRVNDKHKTMKKLIFAFSMMAALCVFGSCKKAVQKTPSVIGEWQSFNVDVLDEYRQGVEERAATDDFFVFFTESEAEFHFPSNTTEEWPNVFKSTYEEAQKNVFRFQQAYDKFGVEITAYFYPDDNQLQVLIGHELWDWWELYYCSKNE